MILSRKTSLCRHYPINMKVYIAVVARTTDYRKNQNVSIDHTSVHPTRDKATRAVMTALIRAFPQYLLEFPLDIGRLLGDEPITDDQLNRLEEYYKTGKVEEWIQDDVPEFGEDDKSTKLFEEFQRKETARMKQQVKKLESVVSTWGKKENQIPFTSLEIPYLPEGEYVNEPIVWKIKEAQLDVPAVEQVKAAADDDEESDGKKRAKTNRHSQRYGL